MLLAIDVGNTETKLGVFANGANELLHHWRVTTESRRTADEYGVFFTQLFATAGLSRARDRRSRHRQRRAAPRSYAGRGLPKIL